MIAEKRKHTGQIPDINRAHTLLTTFNFLQAITTFDSWETTLAYQIEQRRENWISTNYNKMNSINNINSIPTYDLFGGCTAGMDSGRITLTFEPAQTDLLGLLAGQHDVHQRYSAYGPTACYPRPSVQAEQLLAGALTNMIAGRVTAPGALPLEDTGNHCHTGCTGCACNRGLGEPAATASAWRTPAVQTSGLPRENDRVAALENQLYSIQEQLARATRTTDADQTVNGETAATGRKPT